MAEKKITIRDFFAKKKKSEKITAITAYDYAFGRIAEESGIDLILVGDSLGMVFLGYPSTVYVTMEDMLHHLKAVKRAVKRAFLVCDMPFLSYSYNPEDALRNAGRFIQEGGADAVKIEGGKEIREIVSKISNAGIPVMGHIGLNPQKILKTGGYFVQKKDREKELIEDALMLQEAGVFSIVIECVSEETAKKITEKVEVPTIGIGAGRHTDGQILVMNDILGLSYDIRPKFVKRYENFYERATEAFKKYIEDVKTKKFPGEENVYD